MYFINASCTKLLIKTLSAEGLDIAHLCQQAGVDTHLLQNEENLFQRQAVYRLLELAAVAADNPDIGLKTYQHSTLGNFHLVGYVMMSSANLKQALEHLAHFTPLLSNGFIVTLSKEQDDRMCLSWTSYTEVGSIQPRQFSDATTAALLGFCRWLAGDNLLHPQMIEFDYPEPEDISKHRSVFGCPLGFGAERNRLYFSVSDLLSPLSTANQALAMLHQHFAEKKMKQLFGNSLTYRVQTLLFEQLCQGRVDLESIADKLCMSKRTLQRGLEKEGVQFTSLLCKNRMHLANHYLRHTQHSVEEIANLLGFYDQSALHKACIRWFEMPPARYRRESELQQSGMTAG